MVCLIYAVLVLVRHFSIPAGIVFIVSYFFGICSFCSRCFVLVLWFVICFLLVPVPVPLLRDVFVHVCVPVIVPFLVWFHLFFGCSSVVFVFKSLIFYFCYWCLNWDTLRALVRLFECLNLSHVSKRTGNLVCGDPHFMFVCSLAKQGELTK